MGSTFVARRAGIQHAIAAVIVSSSVVAASVNGSYTVTPMSCVPMIRPRTRLTGIPIAIPPATSQLPSRVPRYPSPGSAPTPKQQWYPRSRQISPIYVWRETNVEFPVRVRRADPALFRHNKQSPDHSLAGECAPLANWMASIAGGAY